MSWKTSPFASIDQCFAICFAPSVFCRHLPQHLPRPLPDLTIWPLTPTHTYLVSGCFYEPHHLFTATSKPVLLFLAGTFLNLIRKLKIFGEEVHTAILFGFDLSQGVSLGKKLLQKLLWIIFGGFVGWKSIHQIKRKGFFSMVTLTFGLWDTIISWILNLVIS